MTKQEQLKVAFKSILKQVIDDATIGYLSAREETEPLLDEYTDTMVKEVSIRTNLK